MDKKKNIRCVISMTLSVLLIIQCIFIPESDVVIATEPDIICGDINSDNKINVTDLIWFKSYIIENGITEVSLDCGDINNDEEIDAADCLLLNYYLTGVLPAMGKKLKTDNDSDFIPDVIEEEYNLDSKKADSDGDNLSDYEEIMITLTDPCSAKSNGSEITDDLQDFDNDNLTNIEEIKYGTSPFCFDTDNDQISDYDEIYLYKTSPLCKDSDQDTLSDYAETVLKTDPLNQKSDGKTNDGKRIFNQLIDSSSLCFSRLNDNAEYTFSAEVKASGYAPEHIKAIKSSYTAFLDSRVFYGQIVDISYDIGSLTELTVNFTLNEKGLAGYTVDDYCIGKYSKDIHNIVPVKTIRKGNTLSYTDDEAGTYCVINVRDWISEYEEKESDSEEYSGIDIFFLKYFPYEEIMGLELNGIIEDGAFEYVRQEENGGYSSMHYYDNANELLENTVTNILEVCHTLEKDVNIYGIDYTGVAGVDKDENENIQLYVSDYQNHEMIEKVSGGTVNTLSYSYNENNIKIINKVQFSLAGAIWSEFAMNKPYRLESSLSTLLNSSSSRKKICIILDNGVDPVCDNAEDAINEFKEKGIEFQFYYYPGSPNSERYKELASERKANVWNKRTLSDEILSDIFKNEYTSVCVKGFYGNKVYLKKSVPDEVFVEVRDNPSKIKEISLKYGIEENDDDKLNTLEEYVGNKSMSDSMTIDDKNDFKKMFYGNSSVENTVIDQKGLVLKSKPDNEDSDGDGICDDDDPYPEKAYDSKFVIANYRDKNPCDIIPETTIEHYNKSMMIYGSDKSVLNILHSKTAELLTYSYIIPLAKGLGMDIAPELLYVFQQNETKNLFYTIDDFDRVVTNTRAQRYAFYKHMNMFMNASEEILKETSGQTKFIATSLKKDLRIPGTDLSCVPFGSESSMDIPKILTTFSSIEYDALLSLGGGSDNAVIGTVHINTNGEYEAEVRYCEYDTYNWDTEEPYLSIQKAGFGMPFYSYGSSIFKIKWKKGNRFEEIFNPLDVDLSVIDFNNQGIDIGNFFEKNYILTLVNTNPDWGDVEKIYKFPIHFS